MHICDNKACVNPAHLKIGTHADNSKDMVMKGRQASGERCGNRKLTEETVRSIRLLKGERSSREVAKEYNISKTNVLDIWNYKIWRN